MNGRGGQGGRGGEEGRDLVQLSRNSNLFAINEIMELGRDLRSAVNDAAHNGNQMPADAIKELIDRSSLAMNTLLIALTSINNVGTPQNTMGQMLNNLRHNGINFPLNVKATFDHIISLRNACEHFFVVGTVRTINKLSSDWNEHLIPSVIDPTNRSVSMHEIYIKKQGVQM